MKITGNFHCGNPGTTGSLDLQPIPLLGTVECDNAPVVTIEDATAEGGNWVSQ
jgi:hypothetical protein